jgi:hypothetical protein
MACQFLPQQQHASCELKKTARPVTYQNAKNEKKRKEKSSMVFVKMPQHTL